MVHRRVDQGTRTSAPGRSALNVWLGFDILVIMEKQSR